jgi:hypothetical protein
MSSPRTESGHLLDTAGDRICIFGFSRGAYTARALAGMIHKVGLLPACNFQQVPFAYKMFTQADETGWAQSNAFKKAFSVDVDIEFIGVWLVTRSLVPFLAYSPNYDYTGIPFVPSALSLIVFLSRPPIPQLKPSDMPYRSTNIGQNSKPTSGIIRPRMRRS